MYDLLRPRIWPSFLASSGVPSTSLRTGGPCDVPFRYASASILDLGFRISDFLVQLMTSSLQFGFRHLFSGSHELFSKFSIRIPQSAFRNRRPGGTPIFFALAALRSVPQAGSQFRGLTTAIHEISGLTGPVSLCCPLSFGPAQNRSYDALWIRLFFVGLRTTIRFELLHAATSLNSFLEALPQVVTMAAVFLRLDDAVLISGHTVFRNAKARRPAVRHISTPKVEKVWTRQS